MRAQQTPAPLPQFHPALARRYHFLLDRAEDRAALRVVHLDAHAVAVVEKRRSWRTMQDGLDRAKFRDAGIADATRIDRLAGAAIGVAVRHRAGADDHAAAERPRLRRMRAQRWEIECHIHPRLRPAERHAVE